MMWDITSFISPGFVFARVIIRAKYLVVTLAEAILAKFCLFDDLATLFDLQFD